MKTSILTFSATVRLSKIRLALQMLLIGFAVCAGGIASPAQEVLPAELSQVDSDHDGISDAVEQALLTQFLPAFAIGQHDCSGLPSEFAPDVMSPKLKAENGTVYGQVFPVKNSTTDAPLAEIHYYHLWKWDCGGHGHPFDTEHVSVLVRASGNNLNSATWKAMYWYAAAHENTVCDVSQVARATTLHAELEGARIWISPGKHASYLSEELCRRGCGADKCEAMKALEPAKVVNLGEVNYPMNGSLFISSTQWPLATKMTQSNFPDNVLDRFNGLFNEQEENEIAMFHTDRHPAQGVIAISSHTQQAIADHSGAAISTAADSTDSALITAQDSTGNALQKSYRHTRHALGISVKHVGEALHLTQKAVKK